MIHDIMPGTEDQFQKEMTSAYIGFDPTADSLHIGSLVQIMIFLTGGTGLIGSYILMMLMQEKKQVRALRRSTSNLSTCKKIFSYYQLSNLFSEIIWCEGDINDIPSLEENMKDCDIVIHAAALVSFQKSDLESLKKINIEGTANVMNVALSYNYKRCIYISSVSTFSRDSNDLEVNDVAKITMLFLENKIKNERFLLNGTNISYKNAFNKIADEFGVKRATIKVTPFLKELAWRLDSIKSFVTGRPSLLTKETANSAMKNVSYSSSKVKKTLDYEFIPFDVTIKKYCSFFKNELF